MTVKDNATPVTVIAGFLGSGKTTLLNRLLSQQKTPRCTVLVNDFGEINVDATLIASQKGDTIALKNGCVCCSIGNDLGNAISRALSSSSKPEHILIEASGVSNPNKIMDVARISNRLSPAGIVVLVDSITINQQLADKWIADTVIMQLQAANYLVPSKLDLLPPDGHISLFRTLPKVTENPVWLNHSQFGWTEIERLSQDSSGGKHWPNHQSFTSRTLRSSKILDPAKLQEWLKAAPEAYRLKGWFIDTENKTKLIQAVDKRLEISDSDEDIEDRLIAIVIGNEKLASADQIVANIT